MAKKQRKGGRTTPPGTQPRRSLPRSPDRPIVAAAEQQRSEFWAAYRAKDDALRRRCAALVDPPLTDAEWREADLLQMDGDDATDDELRAYWRAHRVSDERGDDELPDLRFVTDALAAGRDPVAEWAALGDDD